MFNSRFILHLIFPILVTGVIIIMQVYKIIFSFPMLLFVALGHRIFTSNMKIKVTFFIFTKRISKIWQIFYIKYYEWGREILQHARWLPCTLIWLTWVWLQSTIRNNARHWPRTMPWAPLGVASKQTNKQAKKLFELLFRYCKIETCIYFYHLN